MRRIAQLTPLLPALLTAPILKPVLSTAQKTASV